MRVRLRRTQRRDSLACWHAEVFETLTLVQTGKIHAFPVVAMGGAYWRKLREFLRSNMVAEGTIGAEDLALIHTTDSVEEAIGIVRRGYEVRAAAEPRVPQPLRILGESRTDAAGGFGAPGAV